MSDLVKFSQMPDASALKAFEEETQAMPLWLDEYQAQVETWVVELLKAGFDRSSGIKKTFGEQPREIRTGPIVSGVATSTDAQLRSRYCHVQVAAAKRLNFDKDRYLAAEEWSKDLYKIGRYILLHREEFARLMVDQIGFWSKDPKLVDCDDRSRIVHGAAYSALVAVASMLGDIGGPADALRGFKQFVREHIEGAQQEVRDQLYVARYFEDLIEAEKQEEFGHTTSALRHYFKVVDKPDHEADAAVSEFQRALGRERAFCAWRGKFLFLSQGTVNVVMAYRRRLGITENLSRRDLHEQMKGRPWFVPPPNKSKGSHQVRFEGGGQETAWCIDLDKHEMGRLPVSDADFEASLRNPNGDCVVVSMDWKDPRKGLLFVLVEKLLQKQSDA